MGEITGISWCDHTWNPIWGCTKVSPGCQHCYAEAWAKRFGRNVWGPTAGRYETTTTWADPAKWNDHALAAGSRERVFCASMSDVFEDHPAWTAVRPDLWEIVGSTPNLDWLLLTKRPQNIIEMVPAAWCTAGHWPRNVWIGTSVESQEYAEQRIPELLKVPAPVRFLSIEPMLGPVDLAPWIKRLQWVIVGGESGPGARPMHPDWVRSLRDQCVASGVPFFFKQWGEWYPDRKRIYLHAQEMIFGDTVVHRLGKKAAGYVLDDQVWHEFPEPAA